tara:strand:- start:570 stop:1232 length:663 start_codon:yes stop_codon:yes gene_type:complete
MTINEESWKNALKHEVQQGYFKKLRLFLNDRYAEATVFPKEELIFYALNQFNFNETRVVILGQDPYHGENQAHGLAFSVLKETPIPPSLKNIFKEIESDLGIVNTSGDLTPWAKQGVLLLNTTLTVEEGKPLSHQKQGWELFTDKIIKLISDELENVIFILWGAKAISKTDLINQNKHFVLTAPHPSPLSVYRGFYGCKHFSKTNEILKSIKKTPINWKT